MAGYSTRVRQDIARWVQTGLIDAATADALARDVAQTERRSLSFGSILAMMAALLLAAALLIFIAANWEAFPRIARVGTLFAIIVGGYVGGAVLKTLDHPAFGEALWIVAVAAFGGSIALIGQMYHLSGDEAVAMLVWCAGTALAAVILRSNPLTVVAVGIADAWLAMKGGSFFTSADNPHPFVGMALVLYAISLWTGSVAARHLIMLSLIYYLTAVAIDWNAFLVAVPMAAAYAGLFAVATWAPAAADRVFRLGGRLPLHALIGFLTALAMLQFILADSKLFAVAAGVALLGIVAALVLGGRESRGLRWVAYLGFAFELCFIYAVTMQTMLGTAGFFLVAAIILGILAFVIIRVEKSLGGKSARGAAT